MRLAHRAALRAALLIACFAPQAHAQFGVAAVFGTETEIGAQASYYVPLTVASLPGLRVGGDLTLYLPEDLGNDFVDASVTYLEINANGQYPFVTEPTRQFYALGGLNYAYASFNYDGDELDGFDTSGGDVGLNVGAGAQFGGLFGEAKFTLGGFEQLGLAVGYRF